MTQWFQIDKTEEAYVNFVCSRKISIKEGSGRKTTSDPSMPVFQSSDYLDKLQPSYDHHCLFVQIRNRARLYFMGLLLETSAIVRTCNLFKLNAELHTCNILFKSSSLLGRIIKSRQLLNREKPSYRHWKRSAINHSNLCASYQRESFQGHRLLALATL